MKLITPRKRKMVMGMKSKPVIFSLVLLITGFLITFNYEQTEEGPQIIKLSDSQWDKKYFYQKQLLDIEERNKQLREELNQKRLDIQNYEKQLVENEQVVSGLLDRKNNLQKLVGELPVEGKGIEIVLSDAEYIATSNQVNRYIVHEGHIHKVINELLSAGAKAIAINGQRYFSDSYIACTGPVITVDGRQHPAPFVITAIGDQETLYSSLTLTMGVVDQLSADNVEVNLSKKDHVQLEARLSTEG